MGYTATNICLRSVTDSDPVWVTCIKTIPTVLGVAPWLIVRWTRGEQVFPPLNVVAALVGAGLLGQFGGNVVFQWTLGVIGIALTVPLCMGTIIIGSAILGRIFLRESVTGLTITALLVLLTAIWILSLGAQGTSDSIGNLGRTSPWLVTVAVAAGCTSGFAYAVLGVTIRKAVLGVSTVSATTFCVALVGLLTLAPLTLYRVGVDEILHTKLADFGLMLLAGVFNVIAFVALTRALQITSLVYVNALNATQVAMASVAGIVLFQEQASPALALGVSLTVIGLLIMPRHKHAKD